MTTTNFSKLLVGAGILALTATSCSNDIDLTPDTKPGDGRTAFMTINLHDVNRGTRAEGDEPTTVPTTPVNPIFDDGVEDEYTISSARFFFFDASGIYVSEAAVWNGSNMVAGPNDNITLEGNTVVVLENLTTNTNPRYMLTVLNGNGFESEATLEATRMKLTNWANTIEDKTRFVMTTSSYFNTDAADINHTDDYYYASILDEKNFVEGQPEFNGNNVVVGDDVTPVDVYVERLAGKVELDYTKLGNAIELADGRKIYKLNATVAGDPNNQGTIDEGVMDVYVEILGWDLNGTNPESYFSKNLDDFKGANPWNNWNVGQFHRSYWAQSYGYNDKENHDLTYVKYGEISASPSNETSVRYANEFTTKPVNFLKDGKVIASELTHVVLKTRLCDKEGNDLDLVRGTNGVLFNKEDKVVTNAAGEEVVYGGYLSYVLQQANILNGLNVWYLTGSTSDITTETLPDGSIKITTTTSNAFSQVGQDYVKLDKAPVGTGKVIVVPDNDANQFEGKTWAKSNGDGTFTQITKEEAIAALTAALDIATNKGKAEAFTGGASYYIIPIEHETSVGSADKEGYYGFVRNHWYRITINQLLTVGHGVFDPGTGEDDDEGEEIIPNTPEDPAYFVAANLKVLAWKIVNQGVDL